MLLLLLPSVLAQDVSIHESLASGTSATAVYGGTFTGGGWRVDDTNSRLYWDLGVQVERGSVSFTTDDVDWSNLLGDNNEFIQMFDAGDKWSCTRAITFRVYGDLEAASWGDLKLKTWDNTSGLVSEARGGVQDWDGGPHTWTITWDTTSATLARDGVELVALDVTGQDLRIGTIWLPLNSWSGGYSHPIGSVYSNLSFDAWLPGEGSGDTGGADTGGGSSDGLIPTDDVGAAEGDDGAVYGDINDLPLQGSTELAYLLYDLSGMSGTVTRATLTLHAQSDSHAEGDGGSVYAVADTSWSESTLTWASRPALGAQVGSFGAVHPNDAVVVDVTSAVRAGGRVALAVANGGDNGAHFWSKEGGAAATLEVTLEPDSGGDSGDTAVDGGDSGDTAGEDSGPDESGPGTPEDTAAEEDTGALPGAAKTQLGCGCAHETGLAAPWAFASCVLLGMALGFSRRHPDTAVRNQQ